MKPDENCRSLLKVIWQSAEEDVGLFITVKPFFYISVTEGGLKQQLLIRC